VREGNNAEEIKNGMDAFTQKVYAVFGKLYQQQAGQPGPDMGQQPPVNDDGTVNTEGEVK